MPNPHKGYMLPFACFACRRSFKRRYERGVAERPCPSCGGATTPLNRKFKPPARDDIKQWEKVRLLVEQGFLFQSVHDGRGVAVPYPATLAEVGAFIERFRDQAVPLTGPEGASTGV